MSQIRGLFFDEFYKELEKVVSGIAPQEERPSEPSTLADEIQKHSALYTLRAVTLKNIPHTVLYDQSNIGII